MNRGIYTAASALGVLQANMEVMSNNLANISTTGFKQDRVMQEAFQEIMLMEISRDSKGDFIKIGTTTEGVAVSSVATDYGSGILHETGRDTDLAISGEGFFTFQSAGQGGAGLLYSRDGELHVDGEGYLADTRGNRILGENGPVLVGDAPFTASPDGVVATGMNEQAKLKIVVFDEKTDLVKAGGNYFLAGSSGSGAADPGVSQGFLEKSNVDMSAEMLKAIEITRAYEASQRMIQAQDSLLDAVINRVGVVR